MRLVIAALSPSVENREVATLDVTQFTQGLAKNVVGTSARFRQVANPPDPARLLCAGGKRPHDRRTADKRDQVASSHLPSPGGKMRNILHPGALWELDHVQNGDWPFFFVTPTDRNGKCRGSAVAGDVNLAPICRWLHRAVP